jgi:hypothetical protein
MELFPAQESTALKTLLEAVLKSSMTNANEISCDLPTPSPKPMPTMVSLIIIVAASTFRIQFHYDRYMYVHVCVFVPEASKLDPSTLPLFLLGSPKARERQRAVYAIVSESRR